MIVLRGMIDDSGNADDLFSLSCLVSDGPNWFWMESDWQEHLERKKARLIAEGRHVFERYHASDCANLRGDFRREYGWSRAEEHEFSGPLHDLLRKYATFGYSLMVNLRDLEKEIPEVSPNPEGFAYVILLQLLMLRICGDALRKIYPDAIMSLIHDRSRYGPAMQEAFHQMLGDVNFKCRERFTTIAPMGWEQCVALQPADVFAYESFKETERQFRNLSHKPRYSLGRCFGEGSKFGGNAGCLEKAALDELKKSFYSLDESVRAIVLATARVSTKTGTAKRKLSDGTEG